MLPLVVHQNLSFCTRPKERSPALPPGPLVLSCNAKNDVAVLACYEKERAARRVQKSARMLRKRAWRGVSIRVLACYEKVVDRGGHGQSEGSRPGRTRSIGRQSAGADTSRAVLRRRRRFCAVGASGVFSPGRLRPMI